MVTSTKALLPSAEKYPASSIKMKRVEIFVIASHEEETSGYRVCMRMTNNLGCGWSEMFIKKSEKPRDWILWSSHLLRFIGVSLDVPGMYRGMDTVHDERIYRLFYDAWAQTGSNISGTKFPLAHAEEADLLNRSVSYISMF